LFYTDQLNRKIDLKGQPKKIVSLVPSQTEYLYDLGLEEEIAGITKFCIHPGRLFRTKTRIGGTKNVDFEKIKAINPDLIIGNREENEQEQIKALMELYPVWISDIKNIADAFDMMERLGDITGKAEKAAAIIKSVKDAFQLHLPADKEQKLKPAAYLIWNKPMMSINNDTFIHSIMETAGFSNVFGNQTTRYPVVTNEVMKEKNPEYIFLSSEPFPFKETHKDQLAKEFPASRVMLVDGEMFSWYGSRLQQAPAYLSQLAGE
jgi:ABC-type Fe3+-hydroxamate transport system substrate-binding protein